MIVRLTMDFFQHRYYRLSKTLMSFCGQWPYQSSHARGGLLIALIILVISQIIPQTFALLKYRDDSSVVVESAMSFLFEVILVTKMIGFIWNAQRTKKLLNRIRGDWHKWARDREVNILHEYADRGKKIVTVYTVSVYLAMFVYSSQPVIPKIIDVILMNGTKTGQFPYPLDYYYFDAQKYYCYVVMYCYVCLYATVTVIIAGDIILVTHVQHVCGTFAALGHKLERITNYDKSVEKGESRHTLDKKDTLHLALCIDRHNDALEYANLVEATYTWYLCFLLAFGMVFLMAIVLQVLFKRDDPEVMLKCVVMIVTIALHFYVECYISQTLIDHSINIPLYIQNSQWYKLSSKAQKCLQLITMRCRKPCQLTAGKLLVLSVRTYGQTFRTALSYMTVVRSMHES